MPATAAPAETAPDDDDEIEEDTVAFRNALARRISMAVSNEKQRWRSCGLRACKRARGCMAPQFRCANEQPRRPLNAEQEARSIARLQRALRQHLEQLDAEEESAPSAGKSHINKSHKKS